MLLPQLKIFSGRINTVYSRIDTVYKPEPLYVSGLKTLGKVVIAFRGTEPVTEDMTDARIDMQFSFDAFDSSLDQNIGVHSGFKKQYQSIKDKVRQYV